MNICIFSLNRDASMIYHGVLKKEGIMTDKDYMNLLSYYFSKLDKEGVDTTKESVPSLIDMLNKISVNSFTVGKETIYELPMTVGDGEIGNRKYVKVNAQNHIKKLDNSQFREVDYRKLLKKKGEAKQVFIEPLNRYVKVFKADDSDRIWAIDKYDQKDLDELSQTNPQFDLSASWNSKDSVATSINRSKEILDALQVKASSKVAKDILHTFSQLRNMITEELRQVVPGIYVNDVVIGTNRIGNKEIKFIVYHPKIGMMNKGNWVVSFELNDDGTVRLNNRQIAETIEAYAKHLEIVTKSGNAPVQSTMQSSSKDLSKADVSKLNTEPKKLNGYTYYPATGYFEFIVENKDKNAPYVSYSVAPDGTVTKEFLDPTLNVNMSLNPNGEVNASQAEATEFLNKKKEILESVSPDIDTTQPQENNNTGITEEETSQENDTVEKIEDIEPNVSLSQSKGYRQRTIENAKEADVTLGLAVNFSTPGEVLTKKSAGDTYVAANINLQNPETTVDMLMHGWGNNPISNIELNISGNTISDLVSSNITQAALNEYMTQAIQILQRRGITIKSIRGGGQTGIDEAGIMAAKKLGIPYTIHTTSDWKFRDKNGNDISNDKEKFLRRFLDDGIEVVADEKVGDLTKVIPALESIAMQVAHMPEAQDTEDADNAEMDAIGFAGNSKNDSNVTIPTSYGDILLTKSGKVYVIKGDQRTLVNSTHPNFKEIEAEIQNYLHDSQESKDAKEIVDFHNPFKEHSNIMEVFQIASNDNIRMREILKKWLTGEKDELTGLYPADFFQVQRQYIVDLLNNARIPLARSEANFDVVSSLIEQFKNNDPLLANVIAELSYEVARYTDNQTLSGNEDVQYLKSNDQVQNDIFLDKEEEHKKQIQSQGSTYLDYSNIEEIAEANRQLNPLYRWDGIKLLSTLFSLSLSHFVKLEKNKIQDTINDIKNATLLSQEEKDRRINILYDQLEKVDRKEVLMRVGMPKMMELMQRFLLKKLANVQRHYKEGKITKEAYEKIYREFEKITIMPSNKITEKDNDPFIREAKQRVLDQKMTLLKTLFSEAMPMIKVNEGVKINLETARKQEDMQDDDVADSYQRALYDTISNMDSDSLIEQQIESAEEGETVRDNTWDMDIMTISGHASLSEEVKKILSDIKIMNKEGRPTRTVYGDPLTYESQYTHAALLKILKDMTSPEQLRTKLEEAKVRIPWVQQVIDILYPTPKDTGERDSSGNHIYDTSAVERAETLRSLFYKDMRKDIQNYFVHRVTYDKYGRRKIRTIQISSIAGTYSILSEIQANLTNYEQLGRRTENGKEINSTIYDENGDPSKDGITLFGTLIADLRKQMEQVERNGGNVAELVKNETFFNNLKKALNSVGITVDDQLLALALETSSTHKKERLTQQKAAQEEEDEEEWDADDVNGEEGDSNNSGLIDDPRKETIDTLVDTLAIIHTVMQKNRVVPSQDGYYDYFQSLKTYYLQIAKEIGEVTEDEQELNVYNKGKSYYASIMSSYGGKMITRLSNENSQELFNFVEEEFGYDGFFKDSTTGEYLNDWLKTITPKKLKEIPANASEEERARIQEENEIIQQDNELKQKLRGKITQHIVLERDGVEFNDWTPAMYASVMLDQYESALDYIEIAGGRIEFANFAKPLMADSPCAEFIKFRKYSYSPQLGDVKEQMTPLYRNLINQEYYRIRRTRAKIQAVQNGQLGEETLIDNMETGDHPRGLQFCFMPQLNDYIIYNDNPAIQGRQDLVGMSFVEALDMLTQNPTDQNNKILSDLCDEAIKTVMRQEFEDAMQAWMDAGLFASDEDGNLTMVSNNMVNYEEAKQYMNSAKNLKIIKEAFKSAWTEDMEALMKQYENGISYRVDWETDVLNQIYQIIESNSFDTDVTDARNQLTHRPPAGNTFGLENYIWNSEYANSQIIQIMTTDLALYKNASDFQKRFKEIHAPGLRLNTKSKYGQEIEKTIYLADSEIVSNRLDMIYSIFDAQYQKGNLSATAVAQALAKYGYSNTPDEKWVDYNGVRIKTSKVNVADAQAYRSMEGMRSVMDMIGKWPPEMQEMYDNLQDPNYKMNAEDFNLFVNTIKPFFFGNNKADYQTADGEHTQLRLATQHKNSEFALTLLMEAATRHSEYGNSAKLKGLNKFMKDFNIHVAQFESAVKVGGHGKVDISHRPVTDAYGRTYDEALQYWKDEVKAGRKTSEEMRNEMSVFDWQSEDEIYEYLKSQTLMHDANGNYVQTNDGKYAENTNVIHSVKYEDYGIQLNTEEHLLDKQQLVGTQIRKLIFSNISNDSVFDIPTGEVDENGNPITKQYKKKELLQLYNNLITENILETFEELRKIFKNDKELERVLREECQSDARYSLNALLSCSLSRDGKFALPLFDPSQGQKIQNILNSIIKKRTTKQKAKGGTLIQLSSFGYDDRLNLVYKNNKNEEITYEYFMEHIYDANDPVKNSFSTWAAQEKASGNLSIAAYEVFMPAYSRKFYEPLMDENGNLDINKLPKELRDLVGYRVPTEAHYSMAPLRIKGFLPQNNGGVVMLPADITTISGSDFDVDKMYVMLPEFDVVNRVQWNGELLQSLQNSVSTYVQNLYAQGVIGSYNGLQEVVEVEKQMQDMLRQMAATNKSKFVDGFDEIFDGLEMSDTTYDTWYNFKKVFNQISKPYIKQSLKKIQYDYSKETYEQSRKARNNAILDIWLGVLQNKDVAAQALTPGNFDEQKLCARISEFLSAKASVEEKNAVLQRAGVVDATGRPVTVNTPGLVNILHNLDLKTATSLSEAFTSNISSLSPITQINFHEQNAVGGKAIGAYANHNAHHALIQQLNNETFEGLFLGERNQFTLFGHTYLDISSAFKYENGVRRAVSDVSSGFLAASVDNVKDPVLAGLNQNSFTINASMLMARLGYSTLEIGLFMNHPVVKKMTKDFFSKKTYMQNTIFALDWYKREFKVDNVTLDTANTIAKANSITMDQITSDILSGNMANSQVALMMVHLLSVGEDLNTLVAGMRSDTGKGAAGPTIADNYISNEKVESAIENFKNKDKWVLRVRPGQQVPRRWWSENGVIQELYPPSLDYSMSKEELRKACRESLFPYMTAFYATGMKFTRDILQPYMIQCSPQMRYVEQMFKNLSRNSKLNVDTLKSIYQDFVAVQLLQSPMFASDMNELEEGGLTEHQKRDYIINQFPKDFYHFKKMYEENTDTRVVSGNTFLKRLVAQKTYKNRKADTDYVLNFRDPGKTSKEQETLLMNDLLGLLMDDNTYKWGGKDGNERITGSQLAKYLYMYAFYRGGLAFGPNSYGHLISVLFKMNIDGYRDTLYKAFEDCQDEDHFDKFEWFVYSWIYGHADNNLLVPNLKSEIVTKSAAKKRGDKVVAKTLVAIPMTDAYGNDTEIVKGEDPEGKLLQEFCRVKVNGKTVYYRLRKRPSGFQKKALYVRWYPTSQNFLEYEWGKYPWEEGSVTSRTVVSKKKNEIEGNKDYDTTKEDDEEIWSVDNVAAPQTNQNLDSSENSTSLGIPSKEDLTGERFCPF